MSPAEMDRQPVLEGERFALRPLRADDWDALYTIASDPVVWEQHPMTDRWREEVFRAFFEDALAKGGALAIIDKDKGTIVGSSRFQALTSAEDDPEEQSSVEIGWTFLAPRYWGKGANREVKRLMLAHALESVERVDFRVGEANWRSRIALEKIGAQQTRRTELSKHQGKRVLHVIYAITREDFAQGRLAQSA
ncbi:acetyltransferase [Citromicrobium sp. RCC1885]|nr:MULTISPECIES: GNAT family protein [unclassified Citromicrobium]KPM22645.1 acetyltransferase [Citromicrobium sp. RCC1885]KPM26128.1 acetyltransferase [Citromicrobium sp. RCC1878]OAM07773.1 acetyltransferase [Citromicrobium sp. RCC1897]|tara:strand:+ start:1156 stop:1734 length:579 start_codon:yes stop_codon:yes gene_type:complete